MNCDSIRRLPSNACPVSLVVFRSRTVLILALGIFSLVSMSCYTGLVIYAMFYNCDPISTK
ncbi:Protein of unknown function, partial [Gryllus bimaculatus]